MSRQTFLEDYLAGAVGADAIDDYVDRWHDGAGGESLAEHLGFTDAEYAAWVERPDTITAILERHRRGGSNTVAERG